jgi:hypothetical protein
MIASRIDVTMQESSAWPAVKGGTPSPGRGACSAAALGGFLTARIAPSQTAAVRGITAPSRRCSRLGRMGAASRGFGIAKILQEWQAHPSQSRHPADVG